jgi:peptidylprolyl isomerase domain and WD repeat-containing protein 1
MPKNLLFEYKAETDLYSLSQNKLTCLSLSVSSNGKYMAIMSKDKVIRIFTFLTGKIFKTYNESLKYYFENSSDIISNDQSKMEKHTFDKKLVLERETEKYIDHLPSLNVQFDESNKYIVFSSIIGIKIMNFHNDRVR